MRLPTPAKAGTSKLCRLLEGRGPLWARRFPEFAMDDRQDAIAADPGHYQVLFENEHVRALRIVFGPGEESVMHHHPASTLVFLTDGQVRFHLPDGSAMDYAFLAGQAQWVPPTTHRPQNTGTARFEIIQLEVKS